MPVYVLKKPLRRADVRYKKGDSIELPETTALQLQRRGYIIPNDGTPTKPNQRRGRKKNKPADKPAELSSPAAPEKPTIAADAV